MSLIHQEIVTQNTDAFIQKVKDISRVLGIDPNWLMQIMYNESRINPAIVNSIGATGLIQFMPDTAIYLGTTTAALKAMSNVAQLDYVYKYLLPYKGQLNSYIDTYFAVFFPLAIGKPLDWVFQTSKLAASLVAQQNPIFDLNNDRVLTVREVQDAMLKMIPSSFVTFFKKKM